MDISWEHNGRIKPLIFSCVYQKKQQRRYFDGEHDDQPLHLGVNNFETDTHMGLV